MSGRLTLSNLENRGTFRSALNTMFTELYGAGVAFRYTGHITAATAGTALHVVPASIVGTSQRVYILMARLNVNGATAWTDATATKLTMQDTLGVAGITYPKSVLLGNAILPIEASGLTVGNSILQGVGFSVGAGIDLIGDANFAAGSDGYLTVFGYVQ